MNFLTISFQITKVTETKIIIQNQFSAQRQNPIFHTSSSHKVNILNAIVLSYVRTDLQTDCSQLLVSKSFFSSRSECLINQGGPSNLTNNDAEFAGRKINSMQIRQQDSAFNQQLQIRYYFCDKKKFVIILLKINQNNQMNLSFFQNL
ncbi:hypothetical protein TTHERM_00129570 (macronuclear) [Tetrahymena thermophila SB210]|uniref:Uncharacterized protein n=1 Tax=Tetrahymena thermophila (strain SB210) TaxID=312017 RepID=I7M1E6_TETTS|nr:hypothetical protein TTHERM_00129570 [Tetrahymena thermophila SB210]EAR96180.1 hypothetical protein TTHERM_00129570 [Tetrahymena thermophila SB210]|eukprot:XP_001016425.1 hypothetical protein TTHERM_00129570 [Tetrahymena thermophila SB210]